VLQSAAIKMALSNKKQNNKAGTSLPLRGQPLYIGDRYRDAQLRNEIMQ
jgi:hypothetical protein